MIEILAAVAILGVTLTSVLGLINFSLTAASLAKQTTQADARAQEAMEAVRNIRDSDWAKLTNGNHGLTKTLGYWDFLGTENVVDGFTRTILIEGVYRDANNNMAESGNADPNTRKTTVIVSWSERGRVHQVSLVTYFTNWR